MFTSSKSSRIDSRRLKSTRMCPIGSGSIMDCSVLMRDTTLHTARERGKVFFIFEPSA